MSVTSCVKRAGKRKKSSSCGQTNIQSGEIVYIHWKLCCQNGSSIYRRILLLSHRRMEVMVCCFATWDHSSKRISHLSGTKAKINAKMCADMEISRIYFPYLLMTQILTTAIFCTKVYQNGLLRYFSGKLILQEDWLGSTIPTKQRH